MNEQTSEQPSPAPRERHWLLSAIAGFDRGLAWLERTVVASTVLLMAFLMSAHVIGQATFGQGVPGIDELTEMLIVVMTFVGVGYAARCARHISMSAIYDQLRGTARKSLMVVICLGTGALMFYFAYKAGEYVLVIQDRGRVSSALRIPMWTVYTALPIGFTLAGVQYLLTAVRNLVSPGVYRSFAEKEEYAELPVDEGTANEANARSDA